jgi:hypothetical protein
MSLPMMGRAVPRPYTFRFGTCERCGRAVDYRTEVRTGQSVTLLAGTDTPHRHEPPIVVQLDPEQLAEAIVSASRAAREARSQPRETAPASVEPQAAMPAPQTRQRPPETTGEIHGVAVVRPTGGEDARP